VDLVSALLAHGAEPNARIEKATPVGRSSDDYALTLQLLGATPFFQAASYNDLEVMRVLIAGGADPKRTLPSGKTALAAALRPTGRGERRATNVNEQRVLEAVKLIVDHHVDVNAVDDKSGDTPLQLAATLGFGSVVQYLVDKGADLHLANYSGQTPLMAASSAGTRGAGVAELLRKLGATY
jgi:ankyrin repeat protein